MSIHDIKSVSVVEQQSPSLDFLGFVLDNFVSEALNGNGSTSSPLFADPTPDEWKAFEEYLALKRYKLLVKACPNSCYMLTCPLEPHNAIQSIVNFTIQSYNNDRSGNPNRPIHISGASRFDLIGRQTERDGRYNVKPRMACNSPNMCVETHYRSTESLNQFHARLRNMFNSTNIMIVLGLKVFERTLDGTIDSHNFGATVVVYTRGNNGLPCIPSGCNVSFGTDALTLSEQREWTDAITANGVIEAPQVTGVGLEVNQANLILPLNEARLLMNNCDLNNPQYNVNQEPILGENGYLSLNLSHVQTAIIDNLL